MPTRPCLTPDCATLTTNTRCTRCEAAHQQARNKRRGHYKADYPQRAAIVRATATHCWICSKGPRKGDPFQADHVHPADPTSELRPAHRSCNASRGNTPPPTTPTTPTT